MPVALVVEIINALIAAAPQLPEVIALGEAAIGIVQTGVVTPEQEASIRTQLDQVKALVDNA
jgi:hypothetical protein